MRSQWYKLIERLNSISPSERTLTDADIDLILAANTLLCEQADRIILLEDTVEELKEELNVYKRTTRSSN